MIEVVLNDRLGKKVRVKCNEDDTLAAAQLGTRPEKIKIQKWYTIYNLLSYPELIAATYSKAVSRSVLSAVARGLQDAKAAN